MPGERLALPAVGLVTLCSQKKSSPFRTIFPQVDPDNGIAIEPDDDEDIEQGEAEVGTTNISGIGTGFIWRWAVTRQSTTFAIVSPRRP